MFAKSNISVCVVLLLVQESLLCPIIHINTDRGADSNGYPQVTTILQSDNIREIFENVTQLLLDKHEARFAEYKKDFNIQEIVENVTKSLLDKQDKNFRDLVMLLNRLIPERSEILTPALIDKQKINGRDAQTVPEVSALPVDCQDIRMLGDTKSGVCTIYPSKDHGVSVYCDMDNGAWTVIQKRIDGTENFNRDWVSYRNGFGNADHEYWLGNQYIHLLTSSDQYQLRIDMTDQMGQSKHVIYDSFSISDEESGFRLNISGFQGYNDIKDEFEFHNGMKFSTIDRDQDPWNIISCAELYHGGCWYNKCYRVNLNGEHGSTKGSGGIIWLSRTGFDKPLSHVEMKIRRLSKTPNTNI